MQTPLNRNLERIYVMRNIAVVGQILVIIFVHRVLSIPLPLLPMGSAILLLLLLNFATKYRLNIPRPVSETEFFFQIMLDVAELTVLLYFSGGSTNPFVSLYLIPVVVSASSLPWRYTWTTAAAAVACYTLLMTHFEPLHKQTFMLHVYAMWATFVFSTLIIAAFVVKMGESIRERDRLLAKAREEALRSERILALGTLAAGAAHELGTPLATMSLVCEEIESGYQDKALQQDISILTSQIENCKRILTRLIASAGEARAEGGRMEKADAFVENLLEEWRIVRPTASIAFEKPEGNAPEILAERTLSQAILNLLNNAADASPNNVEIELGWQGSEVMIEIRDRGVGLTPEIASQAGEPFFSTKEEGFGIGLFLANASIERMGGHVHLFNREGGGAVTRVCLPAGK
jgi:two-component system sensor histidine kinase RegB